MGAERVDYYSEEDYAQAQWEEGWEQCQALDLVHIVVPCYQCGEQMYREHSEPKANICEECLKENDKIKNRFEILDIKEEEL